MRVGEKKLRVQWELGETLQRMDTECRGLEERRYMELEDLSSRLLRIDWKVQ